MYLEWYELLAKFESVFHFPVRELIYLHDISLKNMLLENLMASMKSYSMGNGIANRSNVAAPSTALLKPNTRLDASLGIPLKSVTPASALSILILKLLSFHLSLIFFSAFFFETLPPLFRCCRASPPPPSAP